MRLWLPWGDMLILQSKFFGPEDECCDHIIFPAVAHLALDFPD